MRETRNAQASIFDHYAKHEIGNQLAMMSTLLDNCGKLISWVEADLAGEGTQRTGRTGLPVESVLRCDTETGPAAELQGIGILPGGQWQLPQLCTLTSGSGTEEVGPTRQHQPHQTSDLGANQPGTCWAGAG